MIEVEDVANPGSENKGVDLGLDRTPAIVLLMMMYVFRSDFLKKN